MGAAPIKTNTKFDMKLPIRTDIKKILNRPDLSRSYNDKRVNGNRIKIVERLSQDDRDALTRELSKRFPHLEIFVDLIDSPYTSGGSRICTAVYSAYRNFVYEL